MSDQIYIPFFDDGKSWFHLVEGAALSFFPRGWAAAGALGYVLWQALEKESVEAKVGDVFELGVGWLVGVVAQEIYRYTRRHK